MGKKFSSIPSHLISLEAQKKNKPLPKQSLSALDVLPWLTIGAIRMSFLQIFLKEKIESGISGKKDLLLDYQNSLENVSLTNYVRILEQMIFHLIYLPLDKSLALLKLKASISVMRLNFSPSTDKKGHSLEKKWEISVKHLALPKWKHPL